MRRRGDIQASPAHRSVSFPSVRPALPTSLPPPPRAVSRNVGIGCMLWFMRLFILPHTITGIVLLFVIPALAWVKYFGTPVTATVDRSELHTSRQGAHYEIWSHYLLHGRRYIDNETSDVPVAVPQTFPGRAVAWAGHATLMHADRSAAHDLLPLIGFTTLWNGVVWVFLYLAWVVPLRQRHLVKHGQAVPGVVTGKHMRGGKRTTYSVSYRFDVSGTPHTGSASVTFTAYHRAREGMPLTVLVDPAKPKRSLPYELSDFKVA